MIISDGYSLEYLPKRNQIIITLPQTWTTITNTVSMVSNRRTHITESEEAAILAVAKAIIEKEDFSHEHDKAMD